MDLAPGNVTRGCGFHVALGRTSATGHIIAAVLPEMFVDRGKSQQQVPTSQVHGKWGDVCRLWPKFVGSVQRLELLLKDGTTTALRTSREGKFYRMCGIRVLELWESEKYLVRSAGNIAGTLRLGAARMPSRGSG